MMEAEVEVLEEMKETEVHMRLVPSIRLDDQLITLMIVLSVMPLLKIT